MTHSFLYVFPALDEVVSQKKVRKESKIALFVSLESQPVFPTRMSLLSLNSLMHFRPIPTQHDRLETGTQKKTNVYKPTCKEVI